MKNKQFPSKEFLHFINSAEMQYGHRKFRKQPKRSGLHLIEFQRFRLWYKSQQDKHGKPGWDFPL